MKLLTKEIEKKLNKFPLCSQDGKGEDAEVIVKFFNAWGVGTWLVTEGEKQDNGDWLFFGWVEIGQEWEAGYFALSELQSIKTIERDLYSSGTVKQLKR